jgi:hypothetical protein
MRAAEFWTPEPIFAGETVFILAGGPSLRDVDFNRLRGRKVITVNSSLDRALSAGLDDGVLFFTDHPWFTPRKEKIAKWRGPVVTFSSGAKAEMPQKVRRIQGEWRESQKHAFPPVGGPTIRKGRNSGHSAIGLAIALGAARVILLGFDMRVVEGRSHHHDEYVQENAEVYSALFLRAFKDWNKEALAFGVTILNATPGSALTEFPFIDLEEVLQ